MLAVNSVSDFFSWFNFRLNTALDVTRTCLKVTLFTTLWNLTSVAILLNLCHLYLNFWMVNCKKQQKKCYPVVPLALIFICHSDGQGWKFLSQYIFIHHALQCKSTKSGTIRVGLFWNKVHLLQTCDTSVQIYMVCLQSCYNPQVGGQIVNAEILMMIMMALSSCVRILGESLKFIPRLHFFFFWWRLVCAH